MDLKSISTDPALVLQLFAALTVPFLALHIPEYASPFLASFTGHELSHMKGVLRGFLIQLPSLLAAMLAANIALEEKEENILRIISLSPTGLPVWYIARIASGLLFTSISIAIMAAIGIKEVILLLPALLLISAGFWFIIFKISSDRMQGLAAGKITGSLFFIGSAAHLFSENWQPFFMWLPSWWVVRVFLNS
jgi:hypothetical protein